MYTYVLIFMLHKLTHCWYRCIFCQFWKSLVWKKIGLPIFFRKSFLKSNLILLLSNLINHMRYWFLCTLYIITLCTYCYLEYWIFFYEQIFGLQNNYLLMYFSFLGNFSLISKHIKKVVDVRKFYECVILKLFFAQREKSKKFLHQYLKQHLCNLFLRKFCKLWPIILEMIYLFTKVE